MNRRAIQTLRKVMSSVQNNLATNSIDTRLQLYELNISKVPVFPPADIRVSISDLPQFPTVGQVSKAFDLDSGINRICIFSQFAIQLLRAYYLDEFPNQPVPTENNMVGSLTGFAGAGKSMVIKALQKFAICILAESELCSYNCIYGIAAYNCNGNTIHSTFGWSAVGIPKIEISNAQKQRFAATRLLILDESSYTISLFFKRLNSDKKHLVMGGVALLMCGDWCQQTPVGGELLFQAIFEQSNSSNPELMLLRQQGK